MPMHLLESIKNIPTKVDTSIRKGARIFTKPVDPVFRQFKKVSKGYLTPDEIVQANMFGMYNCMIKKSIKSGIRPKTLMKTPDTIRSCYETNKKQL